MGKHNHHAPPGRARVRPVLDCSNSPSRTKQEFREECNINSIIARYRLEGRFPNGKPPPSMDNYGDFTSAEDYLSAVNLIRTSEAQFQSLPSEVRAVFRNSPAEFLAAVHETDNLEQLHDWGLLNAEAAERVETTRKGRAAAGAPGGEPKK